MTTASARVGLGVVLAVALAGLVVACRSGGAVTPRPGILSDDVESCGERWPDDCYVVDGLCFRPTELERHPVPLPLRASIDAALEDCVSRRHCRLIVASCVGSASFAWFEDGLGESPELRIYDAAGGGWLAEMAFGDAGVSDDPYGCSHRTWFGDPEHLDCGLHALDLVGELSDGCWADTGGGDRDGCVLDRFVAP